MGRINLHIITVLPESIANTSWFKLTNSNLPFANALTYFILRLKTGLRSNVQVLHILEAYSKHVTVI